MLVRLLRAYLRPYGRPLAALVALQLVATIAVLYLPSLNGDIVDRGVSTGDTGYILTTGALMLAIAGLQVAASIAAVRFGARVAMAYGRDLRAGIFKRVGELSEREVGKFGAPSLITRTTNDVQQVQMLVMMGTTMLVGAPIMCVGGIVMAMREDAGLSWLLLLCVPALAGSIGLIVSRMMPEFRAMQPRIDTVNRVLREQITGMRVVRAFVREPVEEGRFAEANAALTDNAVRVGALGARMWPTVMLAFNASSVAVLWFGGKHIASGELEVGQLIAYLSYLMQILMAVMMTTFIAVMAPRAAVCAERILEVLDTVPSMSSPSSPVVPAPTGVVELRDVEYRYPGAEKPVLEGVSFTASPGTVTALIGATGSGKTTLLELIPRLSDPTGGAVLIDGVDVRDRALEELWARIGVVPQRAYLFTGTIATNLRFGKPDATDDELWAALELAQAAEFVRAMPQQLDAPVAQGGTNVSGGQRQRLAIARALLRDPAVFLFDDAFSALDLTTEAKVRAGLRTRTRDATVILVAQRVSSIVDADQILVLDAGAIVARGTHAELLASSETYREIVTSQLGAEAAA